MRPFEPRVRRAHSNKLAIRTPKKLQGTGAVAPAQGGCGRKKCEARDSCSTGFHGFEFPSKKMRSTRCARTTCRARARYRGLVRQFGRGWARSIPLLSYFFAIAAFDSGTRSVAGMLGRRIEIYVPCLPYQPPEHPPAPLYGGGRAAPPRRRRRCLFDGDGGGPFIYCKQGA